MPTPITIVETDSRFELRPSTIPSAGLGVFTTCELPAGSRLAVVGVCVPADTPQDIATHFADHHKFRLAGDRLLIPLGIGGMVNHSLHANVERVETDAGLVFVTLIDLPAGAELFLCYRPAALVRFGLSD